MHKFVKNVSISLVGGLSAFIILFAISVLVARVIGPEEYGKYAVFFAIAQIISLFFVLELDVTSLYFLSKKTKRKNEIIASIVVMFFLNVIIVSFCAVTVYHFFSFEKLSLVAFVGAIALGFSFALKRMIDAFLRAEGRFKMQSALRFAEAVAVSLAVLSFFYIIELKVYFSYVASIIFGGLLFSFCGFWFLRSFFSFRCWNTKTVNEVFHYNSYGVINAFVNGVVKNCDKILVATVLGLNVAGLYAVYFTASVVIGARVTQLFMNVFFPSVRSNRKNIRKIYQKINTIFTKMFIPFFVCASGGIALIIWLYGNEYQFVWLWVICGGLYIVVHFFASLYGWLLSSISKKGYKFYNISFLYGALGYSTIIFCALVYDVLSVTMFFVALIVYRAISGAFSFWTLREYI